MAPAIALNAHAKLNLTLDITGKEGGYHLLDSIVTTISLSDHITLAPAAENAVEVIGAEIPPAQNTATSAAEAFSARFQRGGARIVIEKHIPVGAGLGGSSADAAGVLLGMQRLYGAPFDALKEIADSLGSDTGYMLTGGFARIRGRGEKVFPLPFAKMWFLVLVPDGGVSTAACYAQYDRMPASCLPVSETAEAALKKDVFGAAKYFKNDLCPPAFALFPAVEEALACARALSPYGAGMTGSGSAVFALFESREAAEEAGRKANFKSYVASSVPANGDAKEIIWKKD